MPTTTIIEMDLREALAEMNKKLDRIDNNVNRPVRNIISSLKCLHHKQLKEYNSFLISHSFSSELN